MLIIITDDRGYINTKNIKPTLEHTITTIDSKTNITLVENNIHDNVNPTKLR